MLLVVSLSKLNSHVLDVKIMSFESVPNYILSELKYRKCEELN